MPPPAKSGSSGRRAIAWLIALLPLLGFGALFFAQRLPSHVRQASLSLAGDWKVLTGNPIGAEGLDFPDASAPRFHIPGGYSAQGFRGSECWLRRTFEL